MSALASLTHLEERLDRAIEHAASLQHGFHGSGDLGDDHVTTYTRPDPAFPRTGHEPIDLTNPYDPTGQGKSGLPEKPGLPSDGTGEGPLPNDGLPSDGYGLDGTGFGFGEGA